ncbi:hypothetical protein C2845_PM05G15880 [Panicum miliaceum]|uniref:Pre-mRNA cleavage factor Im 25 kDa subunit n=1 Tax=Panicum miliaceum TaxID=4540 RepID=A0A3L6SV56_PANMI|nr:hypothetical protein C2845_PM05G15880 [Panicum miliaceum]
MAPASAAVSLRVRFLPGPRPFRGRARWPGAIRASASSDTSGVAGGKRKVGALERRVGDLRALVASVPPAVASIRKNNCPNFVAGFCLGIAVLSAVARQVIIRSREHGNRGSVADLVQEHNHPHILLLQIGNTFCKLLGGRLKPGENEIEGLKRKLCSKLAVNSPSFPPNWQVGECVAVWWRPNFETVMYPYCPPHITKPKECKKLFIVHLSEREYFAVPRNLKLLAVPLFELYDNVQRYGPVISTIPHQLSRFQFNMAGFHLVQ